MCYFIENLLVKTKVIDERTSSLNSPYMELCYVMWKCVIVMQKVQKQNIKIAIGKDT